MRGIKANARFWLWTERLAVILFFTFMLTAAAGRKVEMLFPGVDPNSASFVILGTAAAAFCGLFLLAALQIVLAWLKTIHPFGARKKAALHGLKYPGCPQGSSKKGIALSNCAASANNGSLMMGPFLRRDVHRFCW